ncbi:unnamed protein product [Chondrus crispus]|uniref:DNA replication licensing factor MCM2 n=1 Tax=Chondrus crispus TaxID=2769 RepID=R7Q7I3_CHOCR|nr:unnamed protein product [Chondrus crispus]CDF33351.1 unnamed protein product [Chondrus crispus]|eukprot:XP_005713154.1 unnamed protein product [Chondrus crispus]
MANEPSRTTEDTADAGPAASSRDATASQDGAQPSSTDTARIPDSEEVDELEEDVEAERMLADGVAEVVTARPVEEEEDDGEDLLGEDMVNDYRPLEQLDRYEVDEAAENDAVEEMSVAARRRAEREMRETDRRANRARNIRGRAGAGQINNDDSDSDEEGEAGFQRRRAHRDARREAILSRHRSTRTTDSVAEGSQASGPRASQGDGTPALSYRDDEHDGVNNAEPFDLDANANQGQSVVAILRDDAARKEVFNRFTSFLRTYSDDRTDSLVYMDRIRMMAAENGQSLVVNFKHFSVAEPTVGIWLADAPTHILEIFNEAATDVTINIFPEYERIHPEIFVRISELPVSDHLRDIRHIHLNTLIKVSGVVTRRSGVFPHLRMVKLNCEKCKRVQSPTSTTSKTPERSMTVCSECGSRGPFTVNSEQSLFGNFQKVNLQESPGSVPAGRLPRYKEVILLNDLIDCARPGEEIEVTGVYRHNVDPSINITNGFPVFATVIEANYIRKMEDAHADMALTDDNIAEIRQLSKDTRIAERIFASMAPSIYGHANIKRAIALALFGGQFKEVGEKHRIRGDINLLMMGDPGTAKSQFLKYVEKTAHRAVYATGKGASAVGLTAVVHRDPVTREWTLEGGALVLADRGVCLIDEFDKMNDADRTSIHEAMEQQSISISKAGIVTTLQARCSVFAAANPVKGRYDPSISFFDNVDLTEPILSRFDVLCVVRDTVDSTQDETLAKFVVDSHVRSHPQKDEEDFDNPDMDSNRLADMLEYSADGIELVPQGMLRKYLLYAKNNVHPKLTDMDKEKISSLYIDLRKESMSSGGMPIALRHLESIVRLAEAHAKLHLREYVREDDINMAIAVMLESFFASQKYSLMRQLRRRFHKYLAYRKDDNELLFYVLSGLVRDYAATQLVLRPNNSAEETSEHAPKQVEVDLDDFEARAREMNVFSCEGFYKSRLFAQRSFKVDKNRGKIIKVM